MIIKEREKPVKIMILQALLRRLDHFHQARPKIESDLAKSIAGYKGEQAIDYYYSFFPEDTYQIINGIKLPYKNNLYFQIDILILSKRVLFIIDVKNFLGTVFFDKQHNQFLRKLNESEEGFADPIQQVERHKHQLQYWLTKNKFPDSHCSTCRD